MNRFQKWGKLGGERRARSLSKGKRRIIASLAAQRRWHKGKASTPNMPSVRLDHPSWDDPVYLEEVLNFGGLSEWRELLDRIRDRPFGKTATSLEKVLVATPVYGATPLWQGVMQRCRG